MVPQNKPKVFVTGASGFIGFHIVNRLLDEGCRVGILARPTSDTSRFQREGVTVVPGDIRDEESLAKGVKQADCVVHAAATMRGTWEDFYDINVKSTETLLALSVEAKIKKIVHISSVSVYSYSDMKRDWVFREDMPYEKKKFTYYSKSKIQAEELVWKFHKEQNLACSVLRPGMVYGPGGPLFPALTGLAFGEGAIVLIGFGRKGIAFSYVENVADAVWQCLVKEETNGGCYNLVEDETMSRNRYLKKIKEQVRSDLRVIRVPYPIALMGQIFLRTVFGFAGKKAPMSDLNLRMYARELRFSTDNAKRDLRPEPYVAFDESIRRTVAWNREKRMPQRAVGLENGKVVIASDRTLRVGIIGCGGISIEHLKTLKNMENVRLTALADLNEEARSEMAEKFGVARTYPDVHQILEKEALDVVHVLSPPQTHAEVAVVAMNKGCHVFVEKPMARDSREARRMVAAAEKNGVKLCVDHNHLYDDVMIEARKILASGHVGRIAYVESWYGTQFTPKVDPFDIHTFWGYSLPGSLYQDYLPHPLYLLLDLMKDVENIDVLSRHMKVVPNMASDELWIRMENKERLGAVHLSLSVTPRQQFLKIYGTDGTLTVDLLNGYVFADGAAPMMPKSISRNIMCARYAKALKKAVRRNYRRIFTGKFTLYGGLHRLIQLFYRSILLDEPIPVPGNEGLRIMEIMDEVWSQLAEEDNR